MILYPKIYIDNILKIDEEIIKKYKIKALLLDVDNTILYYNRTMIKGIVEWTENMKKMEIKLCILSNSNHIEKVEKVSKTLKIPYIFFAKKPLKKGYKDALKIIKEKPENVGMVGDQIFTDVLGANRMKMISILTKPLEERDIFITKIKRPLEESIIKRFKKKRRK